jgi:glycosyltransferase involved in cell wall biosynthesis
MARIAHFIDTLDSGGAERVLVELCSRIPALGYEVEVLHFGNVWVERQCARLGLTCERLGRESWYRSKWSVGAFAVAFGAELRRRRIELLHSHLNGPISAGAVAALTARIPHVGTLHDIYHIAARPHRIALLELAAAMGTELVAVSDDMRRFYHAAGRRRLHVQRVYNGVDVAGFGAGPRRGGGTFTFVSVGRLVPLKGYDLLLQALAMTGREGPRLRLVGDGEDRPVLEALAEGLGVRDRVEFRGFREDVAGELAAADGFVLASRSEGLSCSVMEAMAAGLPCVVTDVGGNRELVAEGVNGFLVKAGDAAALAARMTVLARDRQRTLAMGTASRARAETLFSIGATLEAYDGIYRSLLPSDQRRGAPPRREMVAGAPTEVTSPGERGVEEKSSTR